MIEGIEFFGEPVRDPVVVVDYDPEWPRLFALFEGLLRDALGPVALRIDPVGSTAVPGLAAKAVIDIQVSVADIADEDAYRPAIESLGWPLRIREPHHRFFRSPASENPTVHIHVCGAGSKWERDHLLFVAYLKKHGERALRYAALKQELVARFGTERDAYTDAKDEFIAETLEMAERWANDADWRP